MTLFNTNDAVIRKELNKTMDSVLTSKGKDLYETFDLIESYVHVYYDLFDKIDEDALDLLRKNKRIILKSNYILNKKNNQFINNFIDNKLFHNEIAGRVIKKYEKDFKSYIYRDTKISEKEMLDIMYSFLEDEFKNSNEFKKLIDNGMIYRCDLSHETENDIITGGYTIYNYLTKNSIVTVSDDKDMDNVKLMGILMHEFGHVVDNIERTNNHSRKENMNYILKSSYVEVFSLLYEKLFYEYLIKNNIYVDNANCNLNIYYSSMFYNFLAIFGFSLLENHILKNDNYKKIENREDVLDKYFADEEEKENFSGDIREKIIYGYGGLLSNYLVNIKSNEDRFNDAMSGFLDNRFDMFNELIFNKIGTNTNEVIGELNKNLKRIEKPKKIILKQK